MAFPQYEAIEEVLLVLLYLQGDDHHEMRTFKTYDPLANYFDLSSEDRSKTRNEVFSDGRDEPAWANRIQWARLRLNDRELLLARNARHGRWRLSTKGIAEAARIAYKYPDLGSPPKLDFSSLEEVAPEETYVEGAIQRIAINAYERDRTQLVLHVSHIMVLDASSVISALKTSMDLSRKTLFMFIILSHSQLSASSI